MGFDWKELFESTSECGSLRIKSIVNVEVLSQSTMDNGSAPKDVIELFEEYVELRGNLDILSDTPENFR